MKDDEVHVLISEYWQKEFFDVNKILAMGAGKYKKDGWLDEDGKGTSHQHMHDSMFHHLSNSFAGVTVDEESLEDHLLHLACRALMLYTRRKRGIVNPLDKRYVGISVPDMGTLESIKDGE